MHSSSFTIDRSRTSSDGIITTTTQTTNRHNNDRGDSSDDEDHNNHNNGNQQWSIWCCFAPSLTAPLLTSVGAWAASAATTVRHVFSKTSQDASNIDASSNNNVVAVIYAPGRGYERIPSLADDSDFERHATDDEGVDNVPHPGTHEASSSRTNASLRPIHAHDKKNELLLERLQPAVARICALNVLACVSVAIRVADVASPDDEMEEALLPIVVSLIGPLRKEQPPSAEVIHSLLRSSRGDLTTDEVEEGNERSRCRSHVERSTKDDETRSDCAEDGGDNGDGDGSPLGAMDAIEDALFESVVDDALASSLGVVRHLDCVALVSSRATEEDAMPRVLVFAQHVVEIETLESVTLRRCSLSPSELACLALASHGPGLRLRELEIDSCGFGDAHILALARQLEVTQRHRHIGV